MPVKLTTYFAVVSFADFASFVHINLNTWCKVRLLFGKLRYFSYL